MWAALFGPKKPENEHSIQVRFVPGWTAGFIEQRSMQMPSKWTSDTEEWENVSSLAWQGIIRSIEEALYCPETEVIQSKIRRQGVSFPEENDYTPAIQQSSCKKRPCFRRFQYEVSKRDALVSKL